MALLSGDALHASIWVYIVDSTGVAMPEARALCWFAGTYAHDQTVTAADVDDITGRVVLYGGDNVKSTFIEDNKITFPAYMLE